MSFCAELLTPQAVGAEEGPKIFGATCDGGEWWRVKTFVTTLKPAPRLAWKEKWWRVVASFYKGCVGVL